MFIRGCKKFLDARKAKICMFGNQVKATKKFLFQTIRQKKLFVSEVKVNQN